ncbi:signal peptidase complex subunit 1-like [Elgaria multicarinata webbii]|uniref:signal peptidase complex subunit 1-like n=1 Tax=Elgaria multicarinata webbii TaxID=159646 RepID=UPI002FCD2A01
MRRGRKASIPASAAAPASRRRAASANEPEAPVDAASLESDANSQGDPIQLPESRTPPGKAEQPPQASALQPGPQEQLLQQTDTMLGIFRSIPTEMDYKGQKLAEQIFQGIIIFSAVIGFMYGYITEQFGWTVYIVMGGFAVSCLLTLPPWPMYRRNPLKWLPVQESATDDKKPADRKVKRHSKN